MRKTACKAKNPTTCRYHAQFLSPLPPIPERYTTIPEELKLDEEKFDDHKYVWECTKFLKTLTPEELESTNRYVQEAYYPINDTLYGNRPSKEEIRQHIKNLDSALSKAPEAPPLLWRSLSGFDLPTLFQSKNHQPGDIIEFKGYTSTSQTPSALMHIPNDLTWYMRETPDEEYEYHPQLKYRVMLPSTYSETPAKNVLFMIKTRKAAPVSVLRGVTAEQEWVLPRGLKFRITKIHENRTLTGSLMRNNTRATIYEIEENINILAIPRTGYKQNPNLKHAQKQPKGKITATL